MNGGGQNEAISINPELRPSGQNGFAEIKCWLVPLQSLVCVINLLDSERLHVWLNMQDSSHCRQLLWSQRHEGRNTPILLSVVTYWCIHWELWVSVLWTFSLWILPCTESSTVFFFFFIKKKKSPLVVLIFAAKEGKQIFYTFHRCLAGMHHLLLRHYCGNKDAPT